MSGDSGLGPGLLFGERRSSLEPWVFIRVHPSRQRGIRALTPLLAAQNGFLLHASKVYGQFRL
jgi:hypothetical protein